MSVRFSAEIDQRANREVLKAFEKLFKADMDAATAVMNDAVEDIAKQTARSVRNIGGGAVSDSYSHNWSGSSNERGDTGGRAKSRYGVSRPRARRGFPVFLAGSAHPLAHIFELGTNVRTTKGSGKVAGGGERRQFKPASRGKIKKDGSLNRTFNQVAPGVPAKLRAEFAKVKV